MTLVEFLKSRLDEDEQAAKAAPWEFDNEEWPFWIETPIEYERKREGTEGYRDRFTPARVLREIEAKRRLVFLHEPMVLRAGGGAAHFDTTTVCRTCEPPKVFPETAYPCDTIRLLALPYADRSDYRQEWAP